MMGIAAPEVTEIGGEELCGTFVGTRPSIAADGLNQPHIVIDRGSDNLLYIYHKIGGTWSEALFAKTARGSRYDASRLYIPHMEIDRVNDRAWISAKFGCKEWGSMFGGPVWCLNNISTAPSERFYRYINVHKGYQMVVLDPNDTSTGVVLGGLGNWAKLNLNGQTTATGNMKSGSSGEKIRFWISPRAGTDGIWHSAMGGYSRQSSAYQNTTRGGAAPVTYASFGLYPEQGGDFWHSGVCGDLQDPNMAYISVRYNPGQMVNIWDGSQMLFGGNCLLVEAGGAQEIRFPPQLTPAPGAEGGAFLAWSKQGRVRMVHVAQDGTLTGVRPSQGDSRDICAGYNPSMCIDDEGNMHLAYVRSGVGMCYRKLAISGAAAVSAVQLPLITAQDFDGDGLDDVATFDRSTAMWNIYNSSNAVVENYPMGTVGEMPVPGKYYSSIYADMATFHPTSLVWTVRNSLAGTTNQVTFGFPGCTPVPGDYDGDGTNDLAYVKTNGTVYVWIYRSSRTGATVTNGSWGLTSSLPVPGDYDGDGTNDMAVVFTNIWQLQAARSSLGNGSTITNQFTNTFTVSDVPVQADYDGDGKTDFAVFKRSGAMWYLTNSSGGAVVVRQFGYGTTTPVRGDYDGDLKSDYGVYDSGTGMWYIKLSKSGRMKGAPPVALGGATDRPVSADYDGDGTNDVAVYRASDGAWLIWDSSRPKSQTRTVYWGWSATTPVPGDYDGDGTNDVAVYWPAAGTWYIRKSSGGSTNVVWGWSEAKPVPGDYDGDGTDDVAVYWQNGGTWYVKKSSGGSTNVNFGWSAADPVPGDYDGDGTNDISVYWPAGSRWYIRYSSGGSTNFTLGGTGARTVQADYDNDGATDAAIYWPASGSWVVRYLGGGSESNTWGWSAAIPAPGDFDGDGISDRSVYWNGNWYIQQSASGKSKVDEVGVPWGASTEMPIGGAEAR